MEHDLFFIVDHSHEIHRPCPNGCQVLEGFFSIVVLDLNPLIEMGEKKLSSVAIIACFHADNGLAKVGQLEQKLLFDSGKLPGIHFITARALIEFVNKHFVLNAKLFCEKLIDESDIVVVSTDLKYLFAALTSIAEPVLASIHICALIPLFAELTIVPSLFNIPKEFMDR